MLQTFDQRGWILLAGLASAAILATAFGFQYIGGLLPCAMCLWQRWPHAIAIGLAALGAAIPSVFIAGLGVLSMLVNTGISLYHTGVERDWWEGPSSCSGGGGEDLGSFSAEDLLNPNIGSEIVPCGEVAWEMLGLSMASWNGVASLAFAGIWLLAMRAPRRA